MTLVINMDNLNSSTFSYGRGYVYSLQYHMVWCVKYRRPVIVGEIEQTLKDVIMQTARQLGVNVVALETMPDHVHLLVDCTPQHYIPDIIKVFKGNGARLLFIEHPELKQSLWDGHLWNPSYCVATVSDRTKDQICDYINSQKRK